MKNGAYREQIKEIDTLLSPVRVRNAKKDFALLDTAIIDALSFDFWHGKKYQTVITACQEETLRDITLPFLLSAKRSIFLVDSRSPKLESKKDRIRSFFAGRHMGTPEFIEVDFSSMDAVEEAVSGLLPVPASALAKLWYCLVIRIYIKRIRVSKDTCEDFR